MPETAERFFWLNETRTLGAFAHNGRIFFSGEPREDAALGDVLLQLDAAEAESLSLAILEHDVRMAQARANKVRESS